VQEEIRWTDRVEKDEVLIFYRIKEKGIYYVHVNEGGLNGLLTFCIRTAF
jgi:hypothetical protein